jgi:hypothetical protein
VVEWFDDLAVGIGFKSQEKLVARALHSGRGASRARSVSVGGDELERAMAFDALRSFGTRVFGRRPLIGSPPALERLFIASPVGRRHRS